MSTNIVFFSLSLKLPFGDFILYYYWKQVRVHVNSNRIESTERFVLNICFLYDLSSFEFMFEQQISLSM